MIVETSILLQGSEADVIAYCDALFAVSLFFQHCSWPFIFHSMVLLASTPFAPVNLSEASYSICEALGSFLQRLGTSGNLGEASGNLWAPLETSSKFLERTGQMTVFGKWRGKNGIHSSMVV
jgi:hypothetical protein